MCFMDFQSLNKERVMQAEYYRWQIRAGHNNKVEIHVDKHFI